jgi:hypothetical protein
VSARVRLGEGERLLILGHDVVIECTDQEDSYDADDGATDVDGYTVPVSVERRWVYGALDWRTYSAASWGYDEDGDLRAIGPDGGFVGPALRAVEPKDPSQVRWAERRFVRDFGDVGQRVRS